MKKFKALYKGMYDDLKDAEMMIKYAHSIREKNPEDKNLADELAKYATFRLNHFMEFHKLFQTEAKKMPEVTQETVSMCMWEETHEMMQEWYHEIKAKIDKY
jgi:hypothetical protein